MSGLRCQAKRGVMVLRPCSEPGVAACARCQRVTCQRHLSPAAPTLCLDCAAQDAKPATGAAPPLGQYDQDDWGRGMRTWAMFSALEASSAPFDASDRRSFEHRRDEDLVEKPDGPGSILDS